MGEATTSASHIGRATMIEIGDRIDSRYRIESRIATGGMSDVFEAKDLVNKKTVTIKVMREDLLADPKNKERFQNECEAAASLDNPNIVKVYSQGIVDGRPYMASEYVKGQTLRNKLQFLSYLSVLEACEVMLQLTSGIAYIHKHGILHRDIKPDNLFYLNDGTVKITDFGIASPIGVTSDGDSIQGTIYYTAPEILMGSPAGIQSDIYSMGVVFYEILTGNVPFDGANPEEVALKQIKNKFPDPCKIMPSIPKTIAKIIINACRKRPEERYKDALEMHDDIVKAMNDKDKLKERKGLFGRIFGFK